MMQMLMQKIIIIIISIPSFNYFKDIHCFNDINDLQDILELHDLHDDNDFDGDNDISDVNNVSNFTISNIFIIPMSKNVKMLENTAIESYRIFSMKLCDFSDPLRPKYTTYEAVQRVYRQVRMSGTISVLVSWL